MLAVGCSFLLVAMGAATITGATKASAFWLIGCYFLHAIGELCLSPVGLSAMTKLAPRNLVGLMMGLWFMSISVGNYTGGRLAGLYAGMSIVTLFTLVGIVGISVGILLALSARPIVKLAGGVR